MYNDTRQKFWKDENNNNNNIEINTLILYTNYCILNLTQFVNVFYIAGKRKTTDEINLWEYKVEGEIKKTKQIWNIHS